MHRFIARSRSASFLLAVAGTIAASAASAAEFLEPASAPIPEYKAVYMLDTGAVRNTERAGGSRTSVYSTIVTAPGAPWVRLSFAKADLAPGAALRVTSLWDGHSQVLDAEGLKTWENTTAYFNGESVRLEIIAAPGDASSRVVMTELTAGLYADQPRSICGPTDDRVRSFDNRQGRAVPIGCTAWMIYDCARCFLTAGHCNTASLQVIQFNVPLSLPNGTIQNPAPDDQYTVNAASRQGVNGGIGNDWAYFGVLPNSVHGQLPFERYGRQAYTLANPAAPVAGNQIRITGYGTTSPANNLNQVQKTHVGGYSAFFGTTLQYTPDTTGGNSGSPVVLESTGNAIGIHTHAGCTSTGGANQGSSMTIAALRNALTNPLGVCTGALRGDINGDKKIDFADLNIQLGNFGQTVPAGTPNVAFGDLNGDSVVNFQDLNIVLGIFGERCDNFIP